MNRYATWLTIAALCGGVPMAHAQLTSGIETVPCPLAFETSSVGGSGIFAAANAYQNLGNNPGIASNPPLTSPLGNNGQQCGNGRQSWTYECSSAEKHYISFCNAQCRFFSPRAIRSRNRILCKDTFAIHSRDRIHAGDDYYRRKWHKFRIGHHPGCGAQFERYRAEQWLQSRIQHQPCDHRHENRNRLWSDLLKRGWDIWGSSPTSTQAVFLSFINRLGVCL